MEQLNQYHLIAYSWSQHKQHDLLLNKILQKYAHTILVLLTMGIALQGFHCM